MTMNTSSTASPPMCTHGRVIGQKRISGSWAVGCWANGGLPETLRNGVRSMRGIRFGAACLLVVVTSCLILPTRLWAEVFLDLYGGVAGTADDEVTVTRSVCTPFIFLPFVQGCREASASRNVGFDESPSVGGRIGYWGEPYAWIGGALDVSHFSADGDDVEISAVPISLLLMLRVPFLESGEFPKGRLQPYAAVGPSFVVVDYTADLRPDLPEEVDETALGLGGDLRGGVAWQVNPTVALFGEFRYTAVSVNDDPREDEEDSGLEATLRTKHFVAGLSFRF